MLQYIQVKDLVIVRELALELTPGMTALTGETGAGKSILIDALGLVLGNKVDKGMIRNGRDQAEINAEFDLSSIPEIRQWLRDNALDSEDECIVRRILVRHGRSRAFINNRPVPATLLDELGSKLVSIHGQHEHQLLMKISAQRELLDAYASHEALISAMRDTYREYRLKQQQLQELQRQSLDRTQRLDYLQFQIDELRQLQLQPGELEELATKQRRLANAEQLGSDLSALLQLLFDDEHGTQPGLAHACVQVEQLLNLDQQLQPASELLESARIQVEEAVSLLQDYASRVEDNPQLLQEIDRRLGDIHELARKHRITAKALPELLDKLTREQSDLENTDFTLAQLEQEVGNLEKRTLAAAKKLSKSRAKAANRLEKVLTKSMQQLGLKGGRFALEITPLPEVPFSANGADQITFMVSTNPGQPLAPLSKVASGGELSRISLAIQVATTNCSRIPTLIFDEVDVGIGGAIAETVGKLLRQLGTQNQVLCVTHLPQVASQANQHLQVSKSTDGKTTETRISPLNQEQRVEEIARMLGGTNITKQTLAHAREMVKG
jgi:DNA repair protein RecN (Recombination protein N)